MPQTAIDADATMATLPTILGDLDALVDRKIRSFLAGDSNGSELFEALYGDTIDEPVPARLAALLRR
jgi:hypothetical protein